MDTNQEYKGFKGFLFRNKIYFETLVMICLTFAGVLVSIYTYELTKKQFELEKTTSKPTINLVADYDEHGFLKKVAIENDGSPLDNLRVDVLPYMDICLLEYIQKESEDPNHTSIYSPDFSWMVLPMSGGGYATSTEPVVNVSGAKTGHLATINSRNLFDFSNTLFSYYLEGYDRTVIDKNPENTDTNKTEKDTEKYAPEINKKELSFLSLYYYVLIQYDDIHNEKHNEMYMINTCVNCNYSGRHSVSSERIPKYGIIPINEGSTDENFVNTIYEDLSTNKYALTYLRSFPSLFLNEEENFKHLKETIKTAFEKEQFILPNN